MPKRFLRRFIPEAHVLRDYKNLRLFGRLLENPNLWRLNRNTVAGAASIGLFMAFVPLPIQMLLAATACILFGCNLPVAIILVWVSNPITLAPLFFAAYKVGAWLLNVPPKLVEFEISFHWLWTKLGAIWEPFLLGCLVLALISALVGNVAVRLLWRLHVVRNWRSRRRRRRRRPQTL
jgi:uncharacterized protein (DUF2062 family)